MVSEEILSLNNLNFCSPGENVTLSTSYRKVLEHLAWPVDYNDVCMFCLLAHAYD